MARDPETSRAVINFANAHKGNPPDPDKIAAARADRTAGAPPGGGW